MSIPAQSPDPHDRPHALAGDAVLFVMVGAPGTGKSYLARRIADRFGAALIQTDAVRKELFPEPRYTKSEMAAVYTACYRRLEERLGAGRPAIFDATNLREARRADLYAMGERFAAPVLVVRAYAPPDAIRARLDRRVIARDPGDYSDADWKISRRIQGGAQPILYPHIVVNTTVSFAPALRLLERLAARGV